MLKKIFYAIISFVGWMLSPFTWWNDSFVNLPLAYIAASLINRVLPRAFLASFIISYWATNILGIALMYIGAERITTQERLKKGRVALLATLIIYSVVFVLLVKFKIIKPF